MNVPQQTQTTYELATFGTRLIAFIIDSIVLELIGLVSLFVLDMLGIVNLAQLFNPEQIDLFLSQPILLVLGIVVNTVYNWYFWTRRNGQTPGKRMMNIRVIKADGTPLSDTDALLRVFGYYVGRLLLFVGYLWAAFDPQNQAWHDKMANTYVVVAPPEKKIVTL